MCGYFLMIVFHFFSQLLLLIKVLVNINIFFLPSVTDGIIENVL